MVEMELFGIAVTILAAVLTYQGWKNGRWMKMAHQDTQDLIRQTQDLIRQTQDLVRQMHKDMIEAFLKMDDTLREIARLIVAEGERTRQAIK